MKPATFIPYILEALRRFWLIVVIAFAIGIALGVAAFTSDVPQFITYQGTAVLGIAPITAPGITPACAANGIPTLVRSPDAVGLDAPRVSVITAAVETPTLVNVVGTSPQRIDARTGANDAITSLTAYCNDRIQAAFTAQVTALAKQLALQRKTLDGFDRTTLTAQATATNAAELQKQIDDLVSKKEALEDKYVSLAVVASTASTALAATVPVGYSEVNAANTRWAALQKQYDADAQLYDTVASHYRPDAPRVVDLAARVATDQRTLDALRAQLDVPGNLMLSATYAKAFTAQQSAQSEAQQTTDQVTLYANRIAALQAKLPKSSSTTPAVLDAQRQSTVAQATYTALATELANVSAEQARLTANPAVTVAGAATDDTVVVRGRLHALVFALAVAVLFLLLGLIIAIIVYILDDRLITTKQITKLYAKPVIATLGPK